MATAGAADRSWTFITNHGAALALVANNSDIKLAELALRMQITERAARRVLKDLIEAGYVTCERRGRRNHYRFAPGEHMRHPAAGHVELDQLVRLLQPAPR
jgi:predicted ArsR family transcriptional regulator